jgi:serine/threonine-protein kinase
MAPEQAISADQVDHRADLYSFGVMLYEMLSGKRPIEAESPQDVINALARGDVAPLSAQNPYVPPNLSALVDMLVAPNPDKRPSSATTVREELQRFARASAPPSNRPSGFESNTVMTLEPTAGFNAVPGKGTQAMQPQVPSWQPPPIVAQPAWNERQSYPVPPQFQAPNPGVPQWQAPSPGPPPTWQARPAATDPAWGASPHAPVAPPRKRSGLWWVLGVFVAALAGGGIWLSQNLSVLDTSAPPPYPTALPSAIVVPAPMDPGLLPARPASPRVEVTPATRSPSTPAAPKFPFTLPSTLPPLPSNLPDLIPQIPGLTMPANPAAAPSVTPAPAPTPT